MVSSFGYLDHGPTEQATLHQKVRSDSGHRKRGLLDLLDTQPGSVRHLFIQHTATVLRRTHDKHRLGHY